MMLNVTRIQLIVIVINTLFGCWNDVKAAQVSVDSNENMLLKICRLKFCANGNRIVS